MKILHPKIRKKKKGKFFQSLTAHGQVTAKRKGDHYSTLITVSPNNRYNQLNKQRKRTKEDQLTFELTFDPKRKDWKDGEQLWIRENEKYFKSKSRKPSKKGVTEHHTVIAKAN